MRFIVETYGCTMNQGEGKELESKLSSLGHEVSPSYDEAELVVVNTCTVIKPTELKIMKRIRSVVQDGKEVVISGCMASVQRDQLMTEFPDAMIIAPREYGDFLPRFEERYGKGGVPLLSGSELSSTTAIIPIAQGCLGSCTYCITKKARGSLESYPLDRILQQARAHVANGARELLITAQDTGCYGLDIGTDLGVLLGELARIDGDFRVRVGMMNPDSLSMIVPDIVQAWSHEKIYKFLHLPVQSGSDRVLSSMGRSYSVKDFEAQVALFRKNYPEMSLSTDIITGFPEETEEDHRMSVELLRRVQPSIVNVTRYSPRPGTPAAKARGQVPGWRSKERSTEIARLRFEITKSVYSSYVGRDIDVLVTEIGKGRTMIARNDSYVPVVVPSGPSIGDRLSVRIIAAAPTHLTASLV